MHARGRTLRLRIAGLAAGALACLPLLAAPASDPVPPSPLGGGASVSLQPAPPPAAPQRQRAVFVCQVAGVPTFADRPCGDATVLRAIAVAPPGSSAGPGTAATTDPPVPSAGTRPRPIRPGEAAAPAPPAEVRCQVLRRQLDDLNDRMRAGYSAREAARLWNRWRAIKDRLHAGRC